MTERTDRRAEFNPNILRETARILQRHPDFAVPADMPDEIEQLLDELRSVEVAASSAYSRPFGSD